MNDLPIVVGCLNNKVANSASSVCRSAFPDLANKVRRYIEKL